MINFDENYKIDLLFSSYWLTEAQTGTSTTTTTTGKIHLIHDTHKIWANNTLHWHKVAKYVLWDLSMSEEGSGWDLRK